MMKHSTLHLALFMFGLAVSYTPQPLPSYTPQPPPSYSFKPSLSYGPQPTASYNPKPSPSCSTIIIPPAAATGPTTAQFTAGTLPFDAPFLDRVNATSWELWYYDVISPDAHASFTMGFFSTPFSAFQLLPDLGSLDMVAIWGSFPNGTAFQAIVPATEAVITVGPAGSTGDWKDTGVSWASDSGGKDYTVRFDSPKTGITGSMTLQSLSPPHIPCSPLVQGQSLLATEDMGWVSIVPNGAGLVDFVINGTRLQFSGSAYHDMNWGDKPMTELVKSTQFGHGNLGPYAITYVDNLTPDNAEWASGYVTLNNQVLTSSCGNVRSRPSGANSMWPPVLGSPNPDGFHIEYDLGEDGILAIDAKPNVIIMQVLEIYTRWVGSIHGGIVGSNTTYTGMLTWDFSRL